MKVLVLVAMMSALELSHGYDCPDGLDAVKDGCYGYFNASSFDDGQNTCWSHGANMVIVKTQEQNAAAVSVVQHYLDSGRDLGYGVWLGLVNYEDDFSQWVDSSAPASSDFSDFHNDGDTFWNGRSKYFSWKGWDFACLGYSRDDLRWYWEFCSNGKLKVLCTAQPATTEPTPDTTTTTTPTTTTTTTTEEPAPVSCTSGWTTFNGYCFKLVNNQAKGTGTPTCQAMGGQMYRFDDDQVVIAQLMTALKVFPSTNNNIPFWVDASPSGDNWTYPDNSVVPRRPPPRSSRPITNCIISVAHSGSGTFGWQHATCSNKYTVVCVSGNPVGK